MNTSIKRFIETADSSFGYKIALELTKPELFNSPLGGRQSGSEAEHRTANFLVEKMKSIGLTNVRKEGFSADLWQFNGSTLTVRVPDTELTLSPYAYATGGTSAEGITAELVCAGRGTLDDYKGLDVKDKIVLIDIDMYNDWEIAYPTLEAELHGAAAVISSSTGGYGRCSNDAYNIQNAACRLSIPSVNISVNDSDKLKKLLKNGPVEVNLKVDNIVAEGGTSYNIVGEIPGKTDEIIIIGDHYDTHFWGFQDDSAGVALVFCIADTLIKSGYKPEKTLLFVLHGAEEWGAIGTHYDWAIGAWKQINHVHPEWQGKALAFLNFEHPAHTILDPDYYIDSAPELFSMLRRFRKHAPDPYTLYPEGFSETDYHISSWTDSYSYNQAGIPSTCNARGSKTFPKEQDFYLQKYHTQFDDPSTWEEDVFRYNLEYFGTLVIRMDNSPFLELDFSQQAARMTESIRAAAFKYAGVDSEALLLAAEKLKNAGSGLFKKAAAINDYYLNSSELTEEQKKQIKDAAYKANRQILDIFRDIQDSLYKLDWNDVPIIPHAQAQKNLELLAEALVRLKAGDAEYVVNEIIKEIDCHWYSLFFSREVVQYHIDQISGDENRDKLFWGKDQIQHTADLWETVKSLKSRVNQPEADFDIEIRTLMQELENQKKYMTEIIPMEIESLERIYLKLQKFEMLNIA